MSAGTAPAAAGAGIVRGRAPGLNPAAAAFLVLVVAASALAAVPFHLHSATDADWLLFGVLSICASAAQLIVVQTPVHQARYTTSVFFVAGAVLLPPQLVALMCVIAHIPEWIRFKYPWYIQTFNIANWICASLAVHFLVTATLVPEHLDAALPRLALVGAAAAVFCALINHTLLAHMLRLARGKSYRESGLFDFGSFSTEVVLAALGIGFAAVWILAPPLVPFVLAPLLVVYRSLQLPSLEMAARLDPKTELFNARYFTGALAGEIERAKRFERPLSILLADLDLLRDVNNTYGHLAGDVVLRGVADVLREQLRPFDVPCRFGGEEFAVALPEASHDDALAIAERIRQAVATSSFRLPSGDGVIQATLSLGVATYPEQETVDALVHHADLALYRSKALGRNRVSGSATLAVVASDRPAAAPAVLSEPRPAPVPERARRPRSAPGRLGVVEFVAGIAAVAGVLAGFLAVGVIGVVAHRPWEFLAFLALSTGLQLIGTSMYGRGTDAASAIGIIASGFVLGPEAAVAIALVAAAVQAVRKRGKPYRAVFDLADFALSAAASAYVFILLDGDSSVAVGFAVALLAGVTYKAVNVGLLCVAMSIEEGIPVSAIWRERFGWAAPHYLTFGPLAFATELAYDRMGLLGLATFAVPPVLLAFSMRQYLERTRASVDEVRRINEELELSKERVHRTYLATIAALSRSIEAKDDYSGGHVERVRVLSVALARTLGYAGDELDAIEVGALLHDIGKIGVPERILNKPGPLSESEWAEMKQHPVTSDYILSGIEMHPFVRQIVRSSHERIDGHGYPDGLGGDEIPLPARIVFVADAFDALASDRPYRPGRPVAEAMEELRAHVGTQFCPIVLGALECLWRDQPETLNGATTRLRAVG
jgi:diguanylate cyclase (GGDEF)-like protein